MALDLDLGGIEGGVEHDVGNDVEGEAHVGLEHPGVIGRHLAGCVGVDVAADVLDLLGDVEGAAPARCPLNAMCSRKCRDAVLLGPLVAPPRRRSRHPLTEGRGCSHRHRLGDDGDAVGRVRSSRSSPRAPFANEVFEGRRGRSARGSAARGALEEVGQCAAARAGAGRWRLHRVGELRGMGGGERDHGNLGGNGARGGRRHGCLTAVWGQTVRRDAARGPRAHGLGRSPPRRSCRCRNVRASAVMRRSREIRKPPVSASSVISFATAARRAPCAKKKRPLEVRRHLDVHRRRDRGNDPVARVLAALHGAVENVVLVRLRSRGGGSAGPSPWR